MTISIVAIVLILLLFTTIINHLFHHWLIITINPQDKCGITLLYCVIIILTTFTTISLFQDIVNY